MWNIIGQILFHPLLFNNYWCWLQTGNTTRTGVRLLFNVMNTPLLINYIGSYTPLYNTHTPNTTDLKPAEYTDDMTCVHFIFNNWTAYLQVCQVDVEF